MARSPSASASTPSFGCERTAASRPQRSGSVAVCRWMWPSQMSSHRCLWARRRSTSKRGRTNGSRAWRASSGQALPPRLGLCSTSASGISVPRRRACRSGDFSAERRASCRCCSSRATRCRARTTRRLRRASRGAWRRATRRSRSRARARPIRSAFAGGSRRYEPQSGRTLRWSSTSRGSIRTRPPPHAISQPGRRSIPPGWRIRSRASSSRSTRGCAVWSRCRSAPATRRHARRSWPRSSSAALSTSCAAMRRPSAGSPLQRASQRWPRRPDWVSRRTHIRRSTATFSSPGPGVPSSSAFPDRPFDLEHRLHEEPIAVRDGVVAASQAPGTGLRLDNAAVDRTAVRRSTTG